MRFHTALRRASTIVHSALRDLRYGRPLGGTIRTRFAHLGAFHSANSPYDDLARVFAGVEVAPGDVLVDVGCGKGRSINWFLGRYPRNTVYGIELDPQICARTARRLRRFRNVTIVCGDATTELPLEGTVFYLFNPFDGEATARFARTLLDRERRAGPRPTVTIVYYNAKYLEPFRADERFSIRELDDPVLDHRSAVVTLA